MTGPEVTGIRYKLPGERALTQAPQRYPGTAWGVSRIMLRYPRSAYRLSVFGFGSAPLDYRQYYPLPHD